MKAAALRGQEGKKSADGRINWIKTISGQGRIPKKLNDIIREEKRHYPETLHIILVDASGSTLRGNSLSKAKGHIQTLMEEAYLARWQIGLIAFGGSELQVLRTPSKVMRNEITSDLLSIKAGGGSPISAGIAKAIALFKHHKKRYPESQLKMSLLTDGRFIPPKIDIPQYVDVTIIDMEHTGVRLGCCKTLAKNWEAHYTVIS